MIGSAFFLRALQAAAAAAATSQAFEGTTAASSKSRVNSDRSTKQDSWWPNHVQQGRGW